MLLRNDEIFLEDVVLVKDPNSTPYEISFSDDDTHFFATNILNSSRAAELSDLVAQLENSGDREDDDAASAALADQGAVAPSDSVTEEVAEITAKIDKALEVLSQDSDVFQSSHQLVDDVYPILMFALDQIEEDAQLIVDAADIAVNQIQDAQLLWQGTPAKVSVSSVIATAMLLVAFEFAVAAAVGYAIQRGLCAWKKFKVESILDKRLSKRLARLAGLDNRVTKLEKNLHSKLSMRDVTERRLAEAQVLVRAARYSSKHSSTVKEVASKINLSKTTDAAALKKILDDAIALERGILMDKKSLDNSVKLLEGSLKEARSRFVKAATRPRVSAKEVEALISDGGLRP